MQLLDATSVLLLQSVPNAKQTTIKFHPHHAHFAHLRFQTASRVFHQLPVQPAQTTVTTSTPLLLAVPAHLQ